MGEYMDWKYLARFFLHGTPFSLYYFLFPIFWTYGWDALGSLGATLETVGYTIVVVTGFVLFLPVMGFLNSAVTAKLWFPVKMSVGDIFFHGVFVYFGLAIIHLSVAMPYIALRESPLGVVVMFIIISFLDGTIAKKVAEMWRQEYRKGVPKAIEAEWRGQSMRAREDEEAPIRNYREQEKRESMRYRVAGSIMIIFSIIIWTLLAVLPYAPWISSLAVLGILTFIFGAICLAVSFG